MRKVTMSVTQGPGDDFFYDVNYTIVDTRYEYRRCVPEEMEPFKELVDANIKKHGSFVMEYELDN